eukprot:5720212-Amphidinium_carterae.1
MPLQFISQYVFTCQCLEKPRALFANIQECHLKRSNSQHVQNPTPTLLPTNRPEICIAVQ